MTFTAASVKTLCKLAWTLQLRTSQKNASSFKFWRFSTFFVIFTKKIDVPELSRVYLLSLLPPNCSCNSTGHDYLVPLPPKPPPVRRHITLKCSLLSCIVVGFIIANYLSEKNLASFTQKSAQIITVIIHISSVPSNYCNLASKSVIRKQPAKVSIIWNCDLLSVNDNWSVEATLKYWFVNFEQEYSKRPLIPNTFVVVFLHSKPELRSEISAYATAKWLDFDNKWQQGQCQPQVGGPG